MENLIYLSTNMKDEDNIIEWVVYHLIIGFDRILIVDNNSKIPIKKIIEEYNLLNKIDVVEYNGMGAIKGAILNGIVKPYMVKNNVKWFIHLDADEYINLNNNFENIKDFLNKFDQEDTNIIAINWMLFGTNGIDQKPSGLIIDNYTKCDIASNSVKCFVNPKEIIKNSHPHFWIMQGNKGKNAKNIYWKPNPYNKDFIGFKEPIYINHYAYQSYEDFLRRKVNRKRDDIGSTRQLISKEELHKKGNKYVDEKIKNKYSSLIKEYIQLLSNGELISKFTYNGYK